MKMVETRDEITYNPLKRLNTLVVLQLKDRGVHPHLITIISFLFYLLAAISFAFTSLWIGGMLILIGGGFSLLDGQLAKERGYQSAIRNYFESVVDRYSDIFLFIGLLYRYSSTDELLMVFITSLALTGSVLVSYTGVRREFTEQNIKVGFMERPERLTILVLGSFIGNMNTAIYIIAIVANFDTFLRISFIYRYLKKKEVSSA